MYTKTYTFKDTATWLIEDVTKELLNMGIQVSPTFQVHSYVRSAGKLTITALTEAKLEEAIMYMENGSQNQRNFKPESRFG